MLFYILHSSFLDVKIMYQACKFHVNYAFISKGKEAQKLGEEGGVQKLVTWWHLGWKWQYWMVTYEL